MDGLNKQISSAWVTSALDNAGKLAASFGVILACAYLYGYYYSTSFLAYYDISWAMDLFEPQDLVKRGLPAVVMFSGSMITTLLMFRLGFGHIKLFWAMVLMVTLVLAGFWSFSLIFPEVYQFKLAKNLGFAITTFAAYLAAVSIANLAHPFNRITSLPLGALSVLIVFALQPSIGAKLAASPERFELGQGAVVVDKAGSMRGMFITYLGGKIMLMRCNNDREISMFEAKDGVSIRPAKPGECQIVVDGSKSK